MKDVQEQRQRKLLLRRVVGHVLGLVVREHDPAVCGPGQAVVCERGPRAVVAQMLEGVAVVVGDHDACNNNLVLRTLASCAHRDARQ